MIDIDLRSLIARGVFVGSTSLVVELEQRSLVGYNFLNCPLKMTVPVRGWNGSYCIRLGATIIHKGP